MAEITIDLNNKAWLAFFIIVIIFGVGGFLFVFRIVYPWLACFFKYLWCCIKKCLSPCKDPCSRLCEPCTNCKRALCDSQCCKKRQPLVNNV